MPPKTDPNYAGVTCNQECATKIAAYILSGFTTSNAQPSPSLKQSAPALSQLNTSESNCGLAYSTIDMRPPTKQEYSAAVFQLTGINLITQLSQSAYDILPSGSSAYSLDNTLDSGSQQVYSSTANQIAAELSQNNFAAIVNCANLNSEQCYDQLADNFACKAFRRPLSAAERSNYLSIYSASSDYREGVKKVTSSILASNNFLYKSTIGFSLVNNDTSLALLSAVPVLQDSKAIALSERINLNANFSGSDILQISIKSTQNANGFWPVVRIQIGESNYVDLAANQPEATYQFHITGVNGSNSVTITNQQSRAPLEYQTGHSLVISSVKVALSH